MFGSIFHSVLNLTRGFKLLTCLLLWLVSLGVFSTPLNGPRIALRLKSTLESIQQKWVDLCQDGIFYDNRNLVVTMRPDVRRGCDAHSLDEFSGIIQGLTEAQGKVKFLEDGTCFNSTQTWEHDTVTALIGELIKSLKDLTRFCDAGSIPVTRYDCAIHNSGGDADFYRFIENKLRDVCDFINEF